MNHRVRIHHHRDRIVWSKYYNYIERRGRRGVNYWSGLRRQLLLWQTRIFINSGCIAAAVMPIRNWVNSLPHAAEGRIDTFAVQGNPVGGRFLLLLFIFIFVCSCRVREFAYSIMMVKNIQIKKLQNYVFVKTRISGHFCGSFVVIQYVQQSIFGDAKKV